MEPIDLEKLTEPFPTAAHKQRSVGGKQLTYVEGHTVINRLNKATHNQWSFEIKDITTVDVSPDWKLVTARVALTIPGLGTREHIGIQDVHVKGADLVKGAITDALKKAATLFGVGLELYGPDYDDAPAHNAPVSDPTPRSATKPPTPVSNVSQPPRATQPQMNAIRRISHANDVTEEELDEHLRDRFGRPLTELTMAEASAFITWLQGEKG